MSVLDFEHGISAIDTHYVRAGLDASHLIVRDGRAAFVDTGTSHALPRLLAALAAKGLAPEQVDYVLVTHIHLDHAGGAGSLMAALPGARLVVHPRGARHLAEPDKLISGTKAVYGEERYQRLYGEILPVAAARIIEIGDGQCLTLGTSELVFIHTPGHALHHYCIVDARAAAVFTGDSFGLSYREFDSRRGPFIFPTTTPVHFDPDAAHASIDRLLSYRPRAAYLTHYSRVEGLERLAADLHRDLDAFVAIAGRHRDAGEERPSRIAADLREYLLGRLSAHGCHLPEAEVDRLLAMDIELNAQGLGVWLERG